MSFYNPSLPHVWVWLAPNSRRQFHWSILTFKCIHLNFPSYLKQLIIPFTTQYSLRHMDHLFLVTPRISKGISRRAFKFKAPSDWNNLPSSLRSITSFHIFKSSLVLHYKTSCSCFWSILPFLSRTHSTHTCFPFVHYTIYMCVSGFKYVLYILLVHARKCIYCM